MKLYIKSFAATNKAAQNYLIDKTPTVIDHLIKVFLYPDVQEQDHWKREIANTLNTVPVLKSSKQKPKSNFIFENTYGVWKETILERTERIISDMVEVPIEFDQNNLTSAIEEYFKWLSENLSFGTLNFNLIYEEINNLKLKYFK